MIRKAFLLFLIVHFSFLLNAQSKDSLIIPKKVEETGFMPGDIVLNVNIGYPHVTPSIIRASIKAYEKFVDNETLTFTVSNRGVYNLKTEYCLFENLGLGLVASYWDMKVNIQNDYMKSQAFTDNLDINLSALALGVRGNYHLNEEIDSKLLDLYTGITIGTTKYSKDVVFTSTNPDRQIPEEIPKRIYEFKDGWATYFSSTVGARFYPVRFLGINAELGWDRGAFFFAGVALRIGTKPIKSLQD